MTFIYYVHVGISKVVNALETASESEEVTITGGDYGTQTMESWSTADEASQDAADSSKQSLAGSLEVRSNVDEGEMMWSDSEGEDQGGGEEEASQRGNGDVGIVMPQREGREVPQGGSVEGEASGGADKDDRAQQKGNKEVLQIGTEKLDTENARKDNSCGKEKDKTSSVQQDRNIFSIIKIEDSDDEYESAENERRNIFNDTECRSKQKEKDHGVNKKKETTSTNYKGMFDAFKQKFQLKLGSNLLKTIKSEPLETENQDNVELSAEVSVHKDKDDNSAGQRDQVLVMVEDVDRVDKSKSNDTVSPAVDKNGSEEAKKASKQADGMSRVADLQNCAEVTCERAESAALNSKQCNQESDTIENSGGNIVTIDDTDECEVSNQNSASNDEQCNSLLAKDVPSSDDAITVETPHKGGSVATQDCDKNKVHVSGSEGSSISQGEDSNISVILETVEGVEVETVVLDSEICDQGGNDEIVCDSNDEGTETSSESRDIETGGRQNIQEVDCEVQELELVTIDSGSDDDEWEVWVSGKEKTSDSEEAQWNILSTWSDNNSDKLSRDSEVVRQKSRDQSEFDSEKSHDATSQSNGSNPNISSRENQDVVLEGTAGHSRMNAVENIVHLENDEDIVPQSNSGELTDIEQLINYQFLTNNNSSPHIGSRRKSTRVSENSSLAESDLQDSSDVLKDSGYESYEVEESATRNRNSRAADPTFQISETELEMEIMENLLKEMQNSEDLQATVDGTNLKSPGKQYSTANKGASPLGVSGYISLLSGLEATKRKGLKISNVNILKRQKPVNNTSANLDQVSVNGNSFVANVEEIGSECTVVTYSGDSEQSVNQTDKNLPSQQSVGVGEENKKEQAAGKKKGGTKTQAKKSTTAAGKKRRASTGKGSKKGNQEGLPVWCVCRSTDINRFMM